MRTGDIIVVSGQTFISKMIQKVVGSPWTHVALYIGADRVLEIDWNTRAVLTPNTYTKGEFDHVVLRSKTGLTTEQRRKLVEAAVAYQDKGTKYDWLMLTSLFLGKVFPKVKWSRNAKNDFVCTELTDTMLKDIGIDLFPGFEGNLYPHDFLLSQQLKILSTGEAVAA